VINAQLGNQQLLPYILFNHFTAYQLAVCTLLGLITGGFALIRARSMFKKGNRYFLFACVGNWPFSWLVEDFTYFLFNPLDALSSTHWSTWILGGVYAYSPWMPGHPKPQFFIPTWYILVFVWFLGCQWYAHRCTVYDNLLKDEVGHQLLPKPPIQTPTVPMPPIGERVKSQRTRFPIHLSHRVKLEPEDSPPVPMPVPAPEPSPTPQTPVTPLTPVVVPERTTKVRSEDAEAALKRLRERWLKKNDAQTGE